MRWVLLLALVACRRPLAPGQTRCTTSEVFGNLETNCQSGPQMPVAGAEPQYAPQPAYAQPVRGWWCSSRTDAISSCFRYQPQCEQWAAEGNKRKDGTDYYDCAPADVAFCSTSGCAAQLTVCVRVEKLYGRDGAACAAVQ